MRGLLAALALTVLALAACVVPEQEEPWTHWPLRGMHTVVSCSGCHGESTVDPQPVTCGGCHEDRRPSADHYPGRDCIDCHNEGGWGDAIEDHSFFPLEFGHSNVPCLDCHLEDDFAAAEPRCASCHARPENHFAGECEDCHNIQDWFDADFDHDQFFPTPHEGVSACGDCHPSAENGNYDTFTCTDCHAHRRADMDDEHLGEVSGYVYNSNACLDCHPNGEED